MDLIRAGPCKVLMKTTIVLGMVLMVLEVAFAVQGTLLVVLSSGSLRGCSGVLGDVSGGPGGGSGARDAAGGPGDYCYLVLTACCYYYYH